MQPVPQRKPIDNFIKPSILAWRAKYQAEKAETPETASADASSAKAEDARPPRNRRSIPGKNRHLTRG